MPRAHHASKLRRARVTDPAPRGLRPATSPGRGGSRGKTETQYRSRSTARRSRRGYACSAHAPEALLWQAICGGKLGASFKRQIVLGSFIVDFCAPAARLVVEVDGAHHARRIGADKRRDRALAAIGYGVLWLEADLVLQPRAIVLVWALGEQ